MPIVALVALFLVPTQEVTTAFVSVLTFFSLHYFIMENSETGPTISLKLAQSEVQRVPRKIEQFRRKFVDQFSCFDF